MIKQVGVIFLGAWTGLSAVWAETEEEAPVVELPAVVVTASRIPQTAGDVPANVTLLDRQAVEGSAALTMDDLLRQVPGFSLFRRQSSLVAHPTTQGASLRGVGPTGASRSLVLMDGVPMNDPFGGWVHWSRVPMVTVERIEVVRGGGSTVWGNFAMGGVIQILTTPPVEQTLRSEALAGNRGTERFGLFVSDVFGPVGVSYELEHFSTDGYHIVREDQRGSIDIPAFSRHQTLGVGVRVEVAPETTLDLKASYFSETRGNGTPYTGNETDSIRLSSTLGWRAGEADFEWVLFGERADFSSTFSSVSPDRTSETPALDQFDVPGRAVGSGLTWAREEGIHQWFAGLDARWVEGETNEDFFFSNGAFNNRRRAGGEQVLAGIFLEDTIEPNDAWRFSLGVRLDYWKNFRGELRQWNLESGALTEEVSFPDRDDVVVNPRAGVVHHLFPGLSLRGAVYRGYRLPTINELYRPFRVGQDTTLANAELDPERLTGLEAGADFQLTEQWYGKVTGFWNRLENPIANVTIDETPTGGALRQRQNLGRARIPGLELETGYELKPSWLLTASYLLSDPRVTRASQQPELEGKRLAQAPRHQIVLGSNFRWEERVRLNLQGRYIGPQFEDDLNTRRLAGFWVADVSVAREFGPGSSLFAGVENLFDRTYEVGKTGDGLVTIGAPRLVHAGVRWRF